MAPNLIRDCDTAYGQLQSLGAANQLSPEQAAALCRRLIGRLSDLAIWARAGEGDRLCNTVGDLIRQMTLRVCEVHRAALMGGLTAKRFETVCADLQAGLEALHAWAEHGVAPSARLPLSDAAARTPVTVYERAGRRFAVVEGGRP